MKYLSEIYSVLPALFAGYIYFAPNVWIKKSFDKHIREVLSANGVSTEAKKDDTIAQIKAFITFISFLGLYCGLSISFVISFIQAGSEKDLHVLIPFAFIITGFYFTVKICLDPINYILKKGIGLNILMIVGTAYFVFNIFHKSM